MALYQYSWLILLAPLFSFAVIVFGTRVWDILSRPSASLAGHGDTMVSPVGLEEHSEHGGEVTEHQANTHDVEAQGSHGEDHGQNPLDDDEDPKVPQLTMGA